MGKTNVEKQEELVDDVFDKCPSKILKEVNAGAKKDVNNNYWSNNKQTKRRENDRDSWNSKSKNNFRDSRPNTPKTPRTPRKDTQKGLLKSPIQQPGFFQNTFNKMCQDREKEKDMQNNQKFRSRLPATTDSPKVLKNFDPPKNP